MPSTPSEPVQDSDDEPDPAPDTEPDLDLPVGVQRKPKRLEPSPELLS